MGSSNALVFKLGSPVVVFVIELSGSLSQKCTLRMLLLYLCLSLVCVQFSLFLRFKCIGQF